MGKIKRFEDILISSQTLKLNVGYTTGTCAQAAAKAAVIMLTSGKLVETIDVETACGKVLNIAVHEQEIASGYCRCSVIKDSGDDPDVTDGAKICAEVRFSQDAGVTIRGGRGVGRVTRPGLPIAIGEYAINPYPRRMIIKELSPYLSCKKDSKAGFEVIINVPKGEELSKKTYNHRLGIEGGISILGTTGIVEPKSLAAYKASLSLELDVLKACGKKKAAVVLGYVGERFCKEKLGLKDDSIVKAGDYVGFVLEECAKKGISDVILAGHISKLSKVANGQFNTHYQQGDGRLETIVRYAKTSGASEDIVQELLKQETAEAAVEILKNNGLDKTFDGIARAAAGKINTLVKGALNISCYVLSLDGTLLAAYE
jgi:cobalt-precorrin-5B (C1)-methyltransferase